MERLHGWFVAMVLGVALTVGGCDRNSVGPDEVAPPGVGPDEISAIKYYAANDEFVRNDELTFADQEVQPMDYGTFGKIDAAITPIRFGRFVRSVTRTVTVQILPGDTIAIAHIDRDIVGMFKILGVTATNDTILVEKPFNDNAKRNLIFKRVGRDGDHYWRNWIPVATSLVAGETVAPNNLINLTKLQMVLPNGDTVSITDPLNTYLRYRWMRVFQGGDSDVPELEPMRRVQVLATVVSAAPDTDLVALRIGVGTFHKRRMRMHIISEVNNGNGTYTRVYRAGFDVHLHRGFFHAGVDAMTRQTLFDDTAPYSVSWWGLPYRVL